MSRSRKKTPCCHCAGHDGSWKRIYNRKLRRNPVDMREGVSAIPDGMAYRRANESWEISDMKEVGTTFEEVCEIADGDRNWYERWYIRK